MIRQLLRALAWLDARFPPKVVVTQEIFDALSTKSHNQAAAIAHLQGEDLVVKSRLLSVEKSLAALKDGISKGKVPLSASEKDRMRDEFVKGEGEAWGRPQSPVVSAGS